MQGRVRSRWMIMVPTRSLALAALALGLSASAQGVLPVEPGLAPSEDTGSSMPVAFEGFVFEPSGAPAEGAVVVSSAGGQAVTDRNGRYRLEARVPIDAQRVQITAAGRAGQNRLASASVGLPAASAPVRVGPLWLAQGSTCQSSWLPTFGERPGTDASVSALTVFDDGSGPALYAGGSFGTAGGVAANHIARWGGSSWATLDSGMNDNVIALTVFDDGGGPELYAGGYFTTADGVAANSIARWDGSSWAALGSGMNSTVFALTVFDDCRGPALFAGGGFTSAIDSGDSFLGKWGCLDTMPPTLSCPPAVLVIERLFGPPGEVVTFSVTASDDQDCSPSVVCVPPSGSFFPQGTTLVTCTATDASGNQAACQFPVTVESRPMRRRP